MRTPFFAVAVAVLLAPSALAATMVTAKNFQFDPSQFTVAPGEVVTVQGSGDGHTLTAVQKGADGKPLFDTGTIQPAASGTFTAPTTPGQYKFYCQFHAAPDSTSGMIGTLTVQAATTGTTSKTPAPGAALVVGAVALLALAGRRAR